MSTQKERFDSLDSLRGIFAIMVVLYHLRWVGNIKEIEFVAHSRIFVDFFFVLSGFVLSFKFSKSHTIKFKDFFTNRFKRIYPLHIITLLVIVGIQVALLVLSHLGFNIGKDAFSGKTALNELLPNILLLQSWFSHFNHLSFNYASWSISIEFYIYLAFFLTAISNRFKWLFWIIAIFIGGLNLIKDYGLTIQAARGIYGFFLGVISFYIYRSEKSKFEKLSFVNIILIPALIYATIILSPKPSIYPSLVFSICIILVAADKGVLNRALNIRPLLKAGELSYSIYLTHVPTLYFIFAIFLVLPKVFHIPFSRAIIEEPTIIAYGYIVTCLITVIFVSTLTKTHIEDRFYKSSR
ncbi:acyltransferase family protein [Vibrio gangliei]|uniref:acyltransferase family protein n=1 Tax=Vibrio gangliei TaxID=2077090 RepID=UPI000D017BF5|nr:acyltransferase [Vibrio gangliei]